MIRIKPFEHTNGILDCYARSIVSIMLVTASLGFDHCRRVDFWLSSSVWFGPC